MKRLALVAGLVVAALVLPLLFAGLALLVADQQPSPSEKALAEIPPELIGVYQSAAATCEGLDWTILAAIHKVETGFGTGPATSSKGAQGPMQFLPATWAAYGIDGDGDGTAENDNVADAIFSASNLLCANGAGDPSSLASAVWNYNHSPDYVEQVLTLAGDFGVLQAPGDVAYAAPGALLTNPNIVLSHNAAADLEAGVVDARLVSLLELLSRRHSFYVSVFRTGHSKYVAGTTSISNHYLGRAADIAAVDGGTVSRLNAAARDLVRLIASLPAGLRPSETGHPFADLDFPGSFSDGAHHGHIHIGFER
jgi:hypothetical protein